MPTNDNVSPPLATDSTQYSSDDYGRAALLLTESLVHGLCENKTLDTAAAVEITERAMSVQFDQATSSEHATASMWRAHALLTAIATSLKSDLKDGPFIPTLVP